MNLPRYSILVSPLGKVDQAADPQGDWMLSADVGSRLSELESVVITLVCAVVTLVASVLAVIAWLMTR